METQTYERGGIAYFLVIFEDHGQFTAEWTCPVCGETRGSRRAYDSAAAAKGRTQAKVFIEHHLPVHFLNPQSPVSEY